MPETSDPRPYRVSTVGWLFARAAFRDAPDLVDQDTLDRIIERAIEAFETGNVHHTRALFYLATQAPRFAARALDALGMPPRPRRPYAGPAGPDSPGEAAGLLDRLPDGGVTRPLPQPVRVQVLAWEDARRDRDGRMLGVYVPVPVTWPPDLCQHGETICPHCLLSWADNHTLALFDHHGPAGSAAGCQCPTCQPNPATAVVPAPPSQQARRTRRTEPGTPANPPGSASHDRKDPTGGDPPRRATGPARSPHRPPVEPAAAIIHVGPDPVTHLELNPTTGLAVVSYPDQVPARLDTGPHLAVLAAVADMLEQIPDHPAPRTRTRHAPSGQPPRDGESDGGR